MKGRPGRNEGTSTEPAFIFKGYNPCRLSTSDHGACKSLSCFGSKKHVRLFKFSWTATLTRTQPHRRLQMLSLMIVVFSHLASQTFQDPIPHMKGLFHKTTLHVTKWPTIISTCSTNAPPMKHVEKAMRHQ